MDWHPRSHFSGLKKLYFCSYIIPNVSMNCLIRRSCWDFSPVPQDNDDNPVPEEDSTLYDFNEHNKDIHQEVFEFFVVFELLQIQTVMFLFHNQ